MVKTLDFFPVEFFEFKNSSIDNAQLIEKLKNLNHPPKNSQNLSFVYSLHKDQNFTEIFNWFSYCLDQIKIHCNYDCDKFEISSSWYNVSLANRGMHQNYHKHTNSFFSGVYYLTHGSPTMFEDPVLYRANGQIEVLRENYSPFKKIDAEPGKLIIFPSYMYHQSPPHVENFDRCIISFNVLPTGKINSKFDNDASLNLSLK